MWIRCAVGILMLVCLAPAAGAQFGTFRSAVPAVNAGRTPTGVTVGDFDGNGSLDAVTSDLSRGSVTVFLQFFGELYAEDHIDVGGTPNDVVSGKFDGDDLLDIVVANGNDASVVCLKGDGEGSFADPGDPVTVGENPAGLAIGDFNGDLILDVAVANEGLSECVPGSVSVLLGAGDCTFTNVATLLGERSTTAVDVGDLNGDGHDDIVAVNGCGNSATVFLNSGDGTEFTTVGSFATGSEPTGVAIGDFDSDGKADLAISEKNEDAVAVFSGNGSGTFSLDATYDVGTGPSDLAIHDVDGGGSLDVVVTNELSIDVSVLLGKGDGSFKTARSFVADGQPMALSLGDFDGDGTPDVVSANVAGGDGSLSVLRNRGLGVLDSVEDISVGSGPAGVAIGDLDDNALSDVVVVHEGGTVMAFRAMEGGGFYSPPWEVTLDGRMRRAVLAQLDGDGRLDLAMSDRQNDRVVVMLGDGTGGFGDPTGIPTGTEPAAVESGDFNGDGVVDLAASVSGPPAEIAVMIGRGDGTFDPPCTSAVGAGPSELVAADFDLNGTDDLAVVNEAAETVTIVMITNGCSFSADTNLAVQRPRAIVAGLFDDNLWPDLVVGTLDGTKAMWPFLGNGDGTFVPGIRRGGPMVGAMCTREFTGDSLIDLGAAESALNVVYTWSGGGDGRFRLESGTNVSRMPVNIAAADFDGDGRYDAVTANAQATANNISVLMNCVGETWCAEQSVEPAMRGDANGDEVVSSADLVAIAREVADGDGKNVEDIAREGFIASSGGDANGDGRVGTQDRRAVVHRFFMGT